MKTIQQILGFVQGWQHAIDSKEGEVNNEPCVYGTLEAIRQYILDE